MGTRRRLADTDPGAFPARGRTPLLCALLLVLALPVTAGCNDPVDDGRKEVHPEVEFRYDEAIRTSLAEVPASELTRIVLRHAEDGAPVWHTTVVTSDGSEHTLRLTATAGDLLAPPSPGEPAPEPAGVLLEKAELLPEEAVRKVTKPDFGKVVAESLGVREGRTVWFVEVATVEEDHVRRTAVDAVTGRVVDSTVLTGRSAFHEHE
jgi:uncharacterized membrane protein YkoI